MRPIGHDDREPRSRLAPRMLGLGPDRARRADAGHPRSAALRIVIVPEARTRHRGHRDARRRPACRSRSHTLWQERPSSAATSGATGRGAVQCRRRRNAPFRHQGARGDRLLTDLPQLDRRARRWTFTGQCGGRGVRRDRPQRRASTSSIAAAGDGPSPTSPAGRESTRQESGTIRAGGAGDRRTSVSPARAISRCRPMRGGVSAVSSVAGDITVGSLSQGPLQYPYRRIRRRAGRVSKAVTASHDECFDRRLWRCGVRRRRPVL